MAGMTGCVLRYYLQVISGARRGPGAALMRALLAGLEPLYRLAIGVRNGRYDRAPARSLRAELPVLSVGNLTTGGTGKTPMVAWLARRGLGCDLAPGILCRGYRAAPGEDGNEESAWLRSALAGVEVLCDPDRVRGARRLRERGVRWILLDDGFQHRRLHRDLDLVLIDATRPFGFGHLLPRGLLREPAGALRRAAAIVLTRADQCSRANLEGLRRRLHDLAPAAAVFSARHRPSAWLGPGGSETLEAVDPQRVGLISALAHPEAFERTVRALGFEIGTHRVFPDHHHYAERDLMDWSSESLWLTTTKDWIKLRSFGRANLLALCIEMDPGDDGDALWSLVEERVLRNARGVPGGRGP